MSHAYPRTSRRTVSKESVIVRPICSSCGKSARSMCSRCRAVRYCSGECQKNHWVSHRLSCTSLAVRSGSSGAAADSDVQLLYRSAHENGLFYTLHDRWSSRSGEGFVHVVLAWVREKLAVASSTYYSSVPYPNASFEAAYTEASGNPGILIALFSIPDRFVPSRSKDVTIRIPEPVASRSGFPDDEFRWRNSGYRGFLDSLYTQGFFGDLGQGIVDVPFNKEGDSNICPDYYRVARRAYVTDLFDSVVSIDAKAEIYAIYRRGTTLFQSPRASFFLRLPDRVNVFVVTSTDNPDNWLVTVSHAPAPQE